MKKRATDSGHPSSSTPIPNCSKCGCYSWVVSRKQRKGLQGSWRAAGETEEVKILNDCLRQLTQVLPFFPILCFVGLVWVQWSGHAQSLLYDQESFLVHAVSGIKLSVTWEESVLTLALSLQLFFIRRTFGRGHTQWCSRLTSGSVLRNLAQQCSGDHMRYLRLNSG